MLIFLTSPSYRRSPSRRKYTRSCVLETIAIIPFGPLMIPSTTSVATTSPAFPAGRCSGTPAILSLLPISAENGSRRAAVGLNIPSPSAGAPLLTAGFGVAAGAGDGFGEGIPGDGVAGFAKLAGFAAGAPCDAAGFGSAVTFNCCLTLPGWAGICCACKQEADKIRRTAAAASMPVQRPGPLRCSMFGSILTVSVSIFISLLGLLDRLIRHRHHLRRHLRGRSGKERGNDAAATYRRAETQRAVGAVALPQPAERQISDVDDSRQTAESRKEIHDAVIGAVHLDVKGHIEVIVARHHGIRRELAYLHSGRRSGSLHLPHEIVGVLLLGNNCFQRVQLLVQRSHLHLKFAVAPLVNL